MDKHGKKVYIIIKKLKERTQEYYLANFSFLTIPWDGSLWFHSIKLSPHEVLLLYTTQMYMRNLTKMIEETKTYVLIIPILKKYTKKSNSQ
jgi:hypothetical protein